MFFSAIFNPEMSVPMLFGSIMGCLKKNCCSRNIVFLRYLKVTFANHGIAEFVSRHAILKSVRCRLVMKWGEGPSRHVENTPSKIFLGVSVGVSFHNSPPKPLFCWIFGSPPAPIYYFSFSKTVEKSTKHNALWLFFAYTAQTFLLTKTQPHWTAIHNRLHANDERQLYALTAKPPTHQKVPCYF